MTVMSDSYSHTSLPSSSFLPSFLPSFHPHELVRAFELSVVLFVLLVFCWFELVDFRAKLISYRLWTFVPSLLEFFFSFSAGRAGSASQALDDTMTYLGIVCRSETRLAVVCSTQFKAGT